MSTHWNEIWFEICADNSMSCAVKCARYIEAFTHADSCHQNRARPEGRRGDLPPSAVMLDVSRDLEVGRDETATHRDEGA